MCVLNTYPGFADAQAARRRVLSERERAGQGRGARVRGEGACEDLGLAEGRGGGVRGPGVGGEPSVAVLL